MMQRKIAVLVLAPSHSEKKMPSPLLEQPCSNLHLYVLINAIWNMLMA